MKIAYLLGSLNRGGTETLLLDVCRNARKNDLEAICVYRKSGALEPEFIRSGIKLHKLSIRRNIIGYLIGLRKLLILNQIDIVHSQQPIDALYSKLACIGTGIKVILTFHGFDFIENKLSQRIIDYVIKRTDTNIFVSNTQRHYYLGKYKLNPQKQKVVYNGISFDKLDEHQNSELRISAGNKLRTELQVSQSTLLLGVVGNFVPGRDQFTLCRFLKLLQDQKLDFHFVFIGRQSDESPELYNNCERFCTENKMSSKVSFLGSRDDVPQILRELDVFVYSTDHDTFGIAVVEAMAIGIPVFVNDWGVMSEITENGKYATVYKTKDEADLIRVFMLFLQNKQDYLSKAKEASLFVREKYSIEKHIDNLKKVYQHVINR